MNNLDYVGDLSVYCESLFEDYCLEGKYLNFSSYLFDQTDLSEDEVDRVLEIVGVE
jgi:hypothetical protein